MYKTDECDTFSATVIILMHWPYIITAICRCCKPCSQWEHTCIPIFENNGESGTSAYVVLHIDTTIKPLKLSHTIVGNKLVDHSDIIGAAPAGATSSFSTYHLASMDLAKTR